MNLEIVKVQNHGDASKEWVQLRATGDADLKKYILTDTTYVNDTTFSNKLRHLYWGWVEHTVKKGECVFVFTGIGDYRRVSNNEGTISHYFYWGLKEPVWNDTGDTALLLHLNAWATKRALGK